MEVVVWKKSNMYQNSGFMVRISKEEAIKIIASLSTQLANDNPNNGRIEFITKKREYFSISVNE